MTKPLMTILFNNNFLENFLETLKKVIFIIEKDLNLLAQNAEPNNNNNNNSHK